MLLPEHGIGDMTTVLTPLQKGLEEKGATYKLNLRATNFIVDAEGTPIGVRFHDEKNDGIVDIKASKIIVATGGFSCNQEMVSTYVPSQQRLGPLTVNSMGEGHQLCKALGGSYTHMDMEANLMSDLAQVTVWGYFGPNVQVTPQGTRFIKEDQSHDSPTACYEGGFGYWWTIFDNQLINGSQKWNVELNMKNNADRHVGPFDTLDELARAMSFDADQTAGRHAEGHVRELRRAGGRRRGRGVRQEAVPPVACRPLLRHEAFPVPLQDARRHEDHHRRAAHGQGRHPHPQRVLRRLHRCR